VFLDLSHLKGRNGNLLLWLPPRVLRDIGLYLELTLFALPTARLSKRGSLSFLSPSRLPPPLNRLFLSCSGEFEPTLSLFRPKKANGRTTQDQKSHKKLRRVPNVAGYFFSAGGTARSGLCFPCDLKKGTCTTVPLFGSVGLMSSSGLTTFSSDAVPTGAPLALFDSGLHYIPKCLPLPKQTSPTPHGRWVFSSASVVLVFNFFFRRRVRAAGPPAPSAGVSRSPVLWNFFPFS